MQILIINGAATSGKDQFVKFFKKNYPYKCYNWSTIDKVKKIAKKHLGWDGRKTDEARLFLSEIKRIWSNYNNGPFQYMVEKIETNHRKLEEDDKNRVIYFIHCRESDEIQKFVSYFGDKCHSLLILRKNINVPKNKSDENVEHFSYDFTIENNGDLTELEKKAKEFVKKLMENH
jgi:dephospho-CoA kinase